MVLISNCQDDLFAQRKNLNRVSSRIAPTILQFVNRVGIGGQFHVSELASYVAEFHHGCAPDSAGRILRQLRQVGKVNYEVVNRRESLYRVIS